MRKSSDLQGLGVMDAGSGTKLGTVDELVISPDDGEVLAVVLSGGMFGGGKTYIDMANVRAIGADAITVEGGGVGKAEDVVSERIREAHISPRKLVGNKVVTRDGTFLGTVHDYFIEEQTRRVTGLTVGGGLLSSEDSLSADRILSVGPDAVIVLDDGDQGEHGGVTGWAHR
jgi:sporulation protein YlmC with PRC-barrel domain